MAIGCSTFLRSRNGGRNTSGASSVTYRAGVQAPNVGARRATQAKEGLPLALPAYLPAESTCATSEQAGGAPTHLAQQTHTQAWPAEHTERANQAGRAGTSGRAGKAPHTHHTCATVNELELSLAK